jgi:hypothetical protein
MYNVKSQESGHALWKFYVLEMGAKMVADADYEQRGARTLRPSALVRTGRVHWPSITGINSFLQGIQIDGPFDLNGVIVSRIVLLEFIFCWKIKQLWSV